MQRRSTLLLPLAVAVSLTGSLMVGSCAIPLTDLDEAEETVPIHVTALAVGTPISTLVIEVTAEDIHGRLVFNLEVDEQDVAHGVIEVPAGESRTFTVTAYDDHHNVTHTGSETVDVNPGSNPPLHVKLKPVAGEVDVTVRFGDYGVVVTPSAVEFDALGQTAELVATVFDQYDEEVPDAEVVWATTHPTIASVSESGLVTALAQGQATIVATYAGVAGTCEVTVSDLVGQEVCDGVDNNGDGQVDEGLMYCIGGAPAPNTNGTDSCLEGWEDLDGDPTNGCETDLALPTIALDSIRPSLLFAGTTVLASINAVNPPPAGTVGFDPNADVALDSDASGFPLTVDSDVIHALLLIASIPPLEASFYDVIVSNPDGSSGVLVDGLRVVEDYTLSFDVQPVGPLADVPFTLYVESSTPDFQDGVVVQIAETATGNVVSFPTMMVFDVQTLELAVDGLVPGDYDVIVINPDGTAGVVLGALFVTY